MRLSEHIRELRPHAEFEAIKIIVVLACGFAGLNTIAYRIVASHLATVGWVIVFLVSAALFGSSLWMLRSRTVPNPSIGQGGAQLQRTPNGLRRCASVLAGSLFSLLVEAGEKLESPPPDYSKLSDLDVPDPRITRLISDQGIDKRINEVFVHAQDLCLLHGMSAGVPQNVSEVRSKIADLRYLVQEIGR